jgi:hypothetical protein
MLLMNKCVGETALERVAFVRLVYYLPQSYTIDTVNRGSMGRSI